LANELLATRLAERVGLTVPEVRVVDVSSWLIGNTPELKREFAGKTEPCASGLQFGARFAVDPFAGQALDYLPAEMYPQIENLAEFAGMLCIDKWTCNTNGRQAVFIRGARKRKYRACFIDQGYCFNAGEWTFSDAPLRGVFARNDVYANVSGWKSFEPWLSRIEKMRGEDIAECADGIPPEWYGDPDNDLSPLLAKLHERRGRVRELITAFRKSARDPFPGWKESAATVH